MRPRTGPWARVIHRIVMNKQGWYSLRQINRACHPVYNRRIARITMFRETTGWKVWS